VDWAEGGYHATDRPNPRGEIVIGGDSIAMGYFKKEEETKEVFKTSEDGTRWFYSGDIGEVYEDGTIKIIDRKKDLLKLAFGEYVSLGKVEAELKSCPFVDNVCVYGDSLQNFLVSLVSPNRSALETMASKLGIDSSVKFEDLCRDPEVIAEATKQLVDHGKKAGLLKSEIPFKLKLCPDEWTPDNGLVTAALKIRRKPIQEHYQGDINKMYGVIDLNFNKDKNRNTTQCPNGNSKVQGDSPVKSGGA
jgi:long-chain acyl-CoA synthetase